MFDGFDEIDLGGDVVYTGVLSPELMLDGEEFEQLWELRPDEFCTIKIHGREVKTPRWQQAYGADYRYTGQVNRALPTTAWMDALLDDFRSRFDERLNGLLLNWYDGSMGHYIGAHRDSTSGMCEGAPIITLSLGEERIFRFRRWRARQPPLDFEVASGDMIVIPFDTNQRFTHEVPKFKRWTSRRISVTARAFEHSRST